MNRWVVLSQVKHHHPPSLLLEKQLLVGGGNKPNMSFCSFYVQSGVPCVVERHLHEWAPAYFMLLVPLWFVIVQNLKAEPPVLPQQRYDR